MATWEQVLLAWLWVILLKISPESWVNLDFPGVSLPFGVDASHYQHGSNAVIAENISGKESAGFIDAARSIETHSEQTLVSRLDKALGK